MSGKMLGGTEGSGIDVSFLFFMRSCKVNGIQRSKLRESWGGEVNDSREQEVNLIN